MAFKLPKYSELTRDQRTIVNLPFNENHVITGAPGTGKSVIAIHRAADMCKEGLEVLMLVYNRALRSYISSAVESLGIGAEVKTWHSWICGFYRDNFGRDIPEKHPKKYNPYKYIWSIIKTDFSKLGKKYDHVIIDEAQDVPIELIESLLLISENVSCFMDVNQTLSSTYSGCQEVAEVLDVRTAYKLWENFRNPKEIYDFAKLYSRDAEVDTVKESGKKPVMIKCTGYGHQTPSQLTSKMIQYIKRNFALDYIGVFTNVSAQSAIYSELNKCLDDTDVFMCMGNAEINFDKPGVYVLTFNTMKGLEFDAVLIPKCEGITTKDDPRVDNNMFYVATTRASKELFCFYFNKTTSSGNIDVFGPIKGHENLLSWE